jgi:aspartate-semialdehyde dehydrogenase
MKIAVVGATGLVGRKISEVLEENNFPVTTFIAAASEKSKGKSVVFKDKEYPVMTMPEVLSANPDIAIFSAGSEISKKWAPLFAAKGCYVVDNSSAWRMDVNVPLVVPEINPRALSPEKKIIANPNCSTIQMVMALFPLHKKFIIKRIVVSTYQSVTGSGAKGLMQLKAEQNGEKRFLAYPYPVHENVLPHAGDFTDEGYTTEEMKLVNETKKILDDYNIAITATAARVPVTGGHSESVNVEFEKEFSMHEILSLLKDMPGVKVVDNPAANSYPMPVDAEGKNEVFVGRIRRDNSVKNGLNLWIVADNLRKGAALNAVQIAELLIKKEIIKIENI